MKKNIITFSLILIAGVVTAQQAQEQTNDSKIKVEKKEMKSQSTVNSEKKTVREVSNEVKVEEESEPVIIQRLEYKSEDQNAVNVVENENIKPELTNEEIDKQIAIKDSYINAINTKIESVKNNPDQHKKAKKSGWYDQMELNKQTAEMEKQELIKSKK